LNTEKHLILIKGEDKTRDIRSCEYLSGEGKYRVTFSGGRSYEYAFCNVIWLRDPEVYDSGEVLVCQNRKPLSGVGRVFVFDGWVRVRYVSGYEKVYPSHEIVLEKNQLSHLKSRDVFDYLKQLAEWVSVKDEEDQSYLSNQYKKVEFVRPNSVLARYLDPSRAVRTQEWSNGAAEDLPFFPFGFNLSQKEATEKALSEPLSVIEGPPGTGKTQTILNIIANAVMRGKTVAVVSNNNAATSNVLEKLHKYGVGFIAAYLGNRANKDKFFKEQTGMLPDLSSWRLGKDDIRGLETELGASGEQLQVMLQAKNELAQTKQELDALSLEKRYFHQYYFKEAIEPYRSVFRHDASTVLDLWLDVQRTAEARGRIPFLRKIKYLFRYGMLDLSYFDRPVEHIVSNLQNLFYDLKEKELQTRIADLERQLGDYRFEEAMKAYAEKSMTLFKARLAEKYGTGDGRRCKYSDDVFRNDSRFEAFLRDYPVILSTTHALRSCVRNHYLFDYVVMDEASQVDVATGALALSCAKQAVIVGDRQQLPNVVPRETAEITDRIFRQYDLHRAYHYAENSMLSSIAKLFPDVPKTLLREHYRCHPKIIGYCNLKFYNNQLIVLTEDRKEKDALVLYRLAEGYHARGRYNQREIDVILREVIPNEIRPGMSVGIISPYRDQVEKLREAIGDAGMEVDTVHKFQGREKDVIILSTVVNEINEFVDNPNLVNVAVSRAVRKLVVLVSGNEKDRRGNIGDLERYIRYHEFKIVPSQIYSVFDLLYRHYSERLLRILKKVRRVSRHFSENLLYTVIGEVLQQPEFRHLGVVLHQPLRMLIRDTSLLTEAECRFAMNPATHADFLIFNRMDKSPVLVVEVDGYAFHANNPAQLERDRMKDGILAKYGIPVLRMATNQSDEKARLTQKLGELVT